MTGKTERIGPLTKDLPESWECVVCGVSPMRGQVVILISNDDTINSTVTITHEFQADCGIPEATTPPGD